jgi:hypothetical protein
LLPCPISLADFTQSASAIQNTLSRRGTCFSYVDSIADLRQLLPPERELKTARTAYRFNPDDHVTIGAALSNYGVYLAKNNAGGTKTSIGFQINRQQEALGCYAEALRHLRKTNRKDFMRSCQKNRKAARANLRRLKKHRRSRPVA